MLQKKLLELANDMADAAQIAFQDWDFAYGGACDAIAGAMSCTITDALPIEVLTAGQPGDDHVSLLVFDADTKELCHIDIPYWLYEFGAGIVWEPLEHVVLSAMDIVIDDWSDDETLVSDVEMRIACDAYFD